MEPGVAYLRRRIRSSSMHVTVTSLHSLPQIANFFGRSQGHVAGGTSDVLPYATQADEVQAEKQTHTDTTNKACSAGVVGVARSSWRGNAKLGLACTQPRPAQPVAQQK